MLERESTVLFGAHQVSVRASQIVGPRLVGRSGIVTGEPRQHGSLDGRHSGRTLKLKVHSPESRRQSQVINGRNPIARVTRQRLAIYRKIDDRRRFHRRNVRWFLFSQDVYRRHVSYQRANVGRSAPKKVVTAYCIRCSEALFTRYCGQIGCTVHHGGRSERPLYLRVFPYRRQRTYQHQAAEYATTATATFRGGVGLCDCYILRFVNCGCVFHSV
mmetsp:Transcript_3104/g.4483  ORF Transcript_3104/g.4483 Transcript_3104/m.4483 type:complete len:216 (+) Transcript_3104:947-1594(+)